MIHILIYNSCFNVLILFQTGRTKLWEWPIVFLHGHLKFTSLFIIAPYRPCHKKLNIHTFINNGSPMINMKYFFLHKHLKWLAVINFDHYGLWSLVFIMDIPNKWIYSIKMKTPVKQSNLHWKWILLNSCFPCPILVEMTQCNRNRSSHNPPGTALWFKTACCNTF